LGEPGRSLLNAPSKEEGHGPAHSQPVSARGRTICAF
jgi:hypothetical protein